MSADGASNPLEKAGPAPVALSDCPLSEQQQTRNILIYAANWALIYLAAPVTYVGLTQAALLKRLDFTDKTCNLPASVYLWTAPFPVLVVWFFPMVRQLKPLLVSALLVMASTGALAAAAVLFLGPDWVLAALITGAALLGCVNGVMAACMWEIIGRGVSEARRGQALGLAFGAGPVMAVAASLVSQMLLPSAAEGAPPPVLPYPWNFAVVFVSSVPILGVAALLSSRFVVLLPPVEVARQPFVSGVFGGFGKYFGYRLILIATIAYILVYSGHMVMTNITLYTKEATGRPPEDFVSYQLALRFGFKIVAGFCLGWLLMQTNPKTLLVVTAGLTLTGVGWALAVPGLWFLVSFGILGAGELFGVYYPNYILGCSPRSKMRRNMAFTSLVTMPVGFAGVLYGSISDKLGQEDKTFGFQMSFAASMAILVATILLVLVALPGRPRPQEEDLDESERAAEERKGKQEEVRS
jgi:phage shock protein PspC (stress-responsive transcriptional regulator)